MPVSVQAVVQRLRKLSTYILPVIGWTAIVTLPVVLLSMAAFFFEGGAVGSTITNFGDALWWTLVTMSTLGYGNMVPVTAGGKVVSVIAIVAGILLVALLTATLAGRLVERVVKRMGRRPLGKLSNHILVLGWNENGLRIITELLAECRVTREVIVVMADRDRIDELPPDVIFVRGDSTRLASLKKVAPTKCQVAVVLADETSKTTDVDSRVILTTMALRRIVGENIRIICEVISSEDLEYLEGAGASEVIARSTVAGDIISHTVHNPGVASLIGNLLTTTTGKNLSRMIVPEKLLGKQYGEMLDELHSKHGALPIALIKDQRIIVNPAFDYVLSKGDEVFLISNMECRR